MKRRILIAAGAAALTCGVLAAPTAAAGTAGYSEDPCSEQFRVPWALDAWTGTNRVVFSPYGTEGIYCISFHGQMRVYQFDSSGRKHSLNPMPPLFGSSDSKVYFWDVDSH